VALIEQEVEAAPRQRRGPSAPGGVTPSRQTSPQTNRRTPPSQDEKPYGPPGDDDPHIYDAAPRDSVYEVPAVPPPPLDTPPRGKWGKKKQEVGWKMDSSRPRASSHGLRAGPELSLVSLLIQDRRWAREASETVNPDLFEEPRLRAIYDILLKLGADEPLDTVELALSQDAPFAMETFHEIVARISDLTPAAGPQLLEGAVRQFRVRSLDRTLRDLDGLIREVDGDARRELETEREALRQERRALLAQRYRS